MIKFYRIIGISLIIVFGFAVEGKAANISAASCSQQDVQTAINSASKGDTVSVPAGNCTWTTITTYRSSVMIDKEINLRGAGTDLTVITDGTGSLADEEPLIVAANNWRLTGFTFNGMKRRSRTEPAVNGSGTGWRIDHCKFDATSTVPSNGRGIQVRGMGLVDHNTFRNTYQGLQVDGPGASSWSEPLTLGTENAIYVEDNLFDYDSVFDGAMDAYSGARFVFRYNTVINTVMGVHGFDTGGYRSTFSYEIYNNSFTKNTTGNSVVINLRGGTGVVFNNTFNGNYWGMGVVNYRACTDYGGSTGKCTGLDANDGNMAIDYNIIYGDTGSGIATSNDNTGTLLTDVSKTWTPDTMFVNSPVSPIGTHAGATSATVLTKASGTNWGANYLIGNYIRNMTDGSSCIVTANTTTTATCALAKGANNVWQNGNNYIITKGYIIINTTTGAFAQIYDNSNNTITSTPLSGGSRQTWAIGDGYKVTIGWPCKDQIGRTTNQTSYPLYEWNNTLKGADTDFFVNDFCSGGIMGNAHLRAGRDYFNNTVNTLYSAYIYPHPLQRPAPPMKLILPTQ